MTLVDTPWRVLSSASLKKTRSSSSSTIGPQASYLVLYLFVVVFVVRRLFDCCGEIFVDSSQKSILLRQRKDTKTNPDGIFAVFDFGEREKK